MADTPQTLSLVTLAQEYRGDIVKQINRRVVLLKLLPIVRGAGKNVAWVAQSSGHVAENHTDGQTAANFGSDAQVPATLSWGLYRSNVHVTKLAMDAAASTGTPLANRRLWAKNIVDGAAAAAALIEDDSFDGAGTGTLIAGLDVAIGDTTNTYATINRATGGNEYWHPYVVDPGSLTAPTLALLRTDLGTIYDNCGETPDLAVCPTAVFNKIAGLFDANRRWTVVNTARGAVKLDAGYEGIELDGCMFVKSKDATANQIYYINSNYVRFETLPDSEVPLEVLDAVSADDGYGSMPFDMTVHALAEVGPAKRAEVLSTIQLKVEKPNACGVRKNVATS
jgi:hypothetical protein